MPFNTDLIYRPILTYFRKKRMRRFYHDFQITSETRILDVGGEPFNWLLLESEIRVKPKLFFLNLYRLHYYIDGWVIADGRFLPFDDQSFDIVYCNSVIEHLYSLENQKLLADEIQRVGKNFYIQTPNKYFFFEPHYLTPFVHWLPSNTRKRVVRNFTVWGLLTRPSPQMCEERIKEIRLLGIQELKLLFPNSQIWYENVLGFKKSFIATKKRLIL